MSQEIVESRLIEAILDGTFPANSHLPAERELAESLGVTRPTLREALQRLTRDGWVEIHHGKPTRVRDYLTEGNLGVLNALAENPNFSPQNFVPDLLSVRLAMAPMYAKLAVENAPTFWDSWNAASLWTTRPGPSAISTGHSTTPSPSSAVIPSSS